MVRVPWKNSGIDTEWPEHDAYLTDFQEDVTFTIQSLINKSIEEKPEINAKTKQIQVQKYAIYVERIIPKSRAYEGLNERGVCQWAYSWCSRCQIGY